MSPIKKNISRTRNPPMHRAKFGVPEPANATNEEITAQQVRLLALRAEHPRNNEYLRPKRVAAQTTRNKNKRLVAVDKSHMKLFNENGVQSLFFVHCPNDKGTSWGHNVCGPDAQKLLNSPIGQEFLASWKRMSDGLEAGGVQRRPPLPPIENVLDVEHPGQPLQENGRTTTPVNDESDRGDEVERYFYVSPINIPSMSESELSNPSFFAQSDIHTTPAQSQIINDTGLSLNVVARETGSSPNSSIDTPTPDQTSRSSTPFPSEPFPMQQNETNPAPISRNSPFLFPVFSGQEKTPWTPPATPQLSKLTDIPVAPTNCRRLPASTNRASQSQVVDETDNTDTQVPSSRGNHAGSHGGNRQVRFQSYQKLYKITDAYLFNKNYYVKVPGNNTLFPFKFDTRFGIPKHIKIHEMEADRESR